MSQGVLANGVEGSYVHPLVKRPLEDIAAHEFVHRVIADTKNAHVRDRGITFGPYDPNHRSLKVTLRTRDGMQDARIFVDPEHLDQVKSYIQSMPDTYRKCFK